MNENIHTREGVCAPSASIQDYLPSILASRRLVQHAHGGGE